MGECQCDLCRKGNKYLRLVHKYVPEDERGPFLQMLSDWMEEGFDANEYRWRYEQLLRDRNKE